MRRAEKNLWTRSKIPPLQAERAPMWRPRVQTCFGNGSCGSANHLEYQEPEKHRRGAARERLPRRRVPAIHGIANGAARELRWPRKTFFLEKAAWTHRLVKPRRFYFGTGAQYQPQKRGYIQGSSLASRVFAILPWPRRDLRQFQEGDLPSPCRSIATEVVAFASFCARTTKRKTSFRGNSRQNVLTPARANCRRLTEAKPDFQDLIIAGLCQFAAAKQQIGRRYTRRDSRVAGRAR